MKKTNISLSKKYDTSSFSGKGVYQNTDEMGNEDIILIGNNGAWFNIGNHSDWEGVFDVEEPKPQGVSEELFLKTMKIITKRNKK